MTINNLSTFRMLKVSLEPHLEPHTRFHMWFHFEISNIFFIIY